MVASDMMNALMALCEEKHIDQGELIWSEHAAHIRSVGGSSPLLATILFTKMY